jgi:hypothetical protein
VAASSLVGTRPAAMKGVAAPPWLALPHSPCPPASTASPSLSYRYLSPHLYSVAAAWSAPPHQPLWYLPYPWHLPAVCVSQPTQLPLGLHTRNAIPSDVILGDQLVHSMPCLPRGWWGFSTYHEGGEDLVHTNTVPKAGEQNWNPAC